MSLKIHQFSPVVTQGFIQLGSPVTWVVPLRRFMTSVDLGAALASSLSTQALCRERWGIVSAVGPALALSAFLRGEKDKHSANHIKINEVSTIRAHRTEKQLLRSLETFDLL